MSKGRKGRLFGYEGDEVWFFDSEGLKSGRRYLTREAALKKNHAWRDERQIDSAISQVRAVVNQALTAYPAINISRIEIGPRLAVLLYLKGLLTKESLNDATLRAQDTHVAIPNVSIMPGLTVRVWVFSDSLWDGHFSIRAMGPRNKILAEL